jgi:hypothetical protein
MAMKPKAPNPMGSGKSSRAPKPRAVKLRGTPAPMPKYERGRAPGAPKPAPMPTRVPNLSLPKDQREKAKRMPLGPKKKSSGAATPKPKAKKPTLDDFLLKGKRPPMKIKPGLTRPKDYDVIIKGFNDKNTINKYKKGK